MEEDKYKEKINLESMDKKSVHSVPDGYFDKLPYSIQEKIAMKEKPLFEGWKLKPAKYAVAGFCLLMFTVFIYLTIPKDQKLVSKKDIIEIKKDSLYNSIENNQQKAKDKEIVPAPLSNNSVAIDQPKMKILNKDSDKNKDTIPLEEKLGSPESYLVEMSAEEIQEYLDINEQDDFQMDDILSDQSGGY
jgi:hypothetical protein